MISDETSLHNDEEKSSLDLPPGPPIGNVHDNGGSDSDSEKGGPPSVDNLGLDERKEEEEEVGNSCRIS